MRPRIIGICEALFLATILVGVGEAVWSWGYEAPDGLPLVIAVQVAFFATLTALILLVSRRASWLALLALLLVFLTRLPDFAEPAHWGRLLRYRWMGHAQTMGQIAAFACLLTRPGRAWFRREPV